MKRIAIFSDIHGNYQALKSILDDIKEDSFDEVICLGDVVAIGPESSLCLDLIRNSSIKMLLGNHELYQIKGCNIDSLPPSVVEHEDFVRESLKEEEKKYLEQCPLSYEFLEKGHLFTFSHFFLKEKSNDPYPFYPFEMVEQEGRNTIISRYESDYSFFGHEHTSFEMIDDKRLFYCVGSSGCVSENITFYTILEIDGDWIKIQRKNVIYDRKAFEKSFRAKDFPAKRETASFFGISHL